MFRFFFSAVSFFFFFNVLAAQTDNAPTRPLPVQYLSPVDANLHNETKEVEGFARKLAALKTAFAEKETSRIIAYESYLLEAMRQEADQMAAKATAESAQAERRKSASSGQITTAAKPDEAPARDPFAEATTPTEIRLEKMTYTLAAFDRHAFDPAQLEAAARDFAKLDEFLKIMQEELEELKK